MSKRHMKGMRKCKVCGKPTVNPTWCSNKCVDIAEGNAPRGTVPMGHESPHSRHYDPGGDKFEPHDRRPND